MPFIFGTYLTWDNTYQCSPKLIVNPYDLDLDLRVYS